MATIVPSLAVLQSFADSILSDISFTQFVTTWVNNPDSDSSLNSVAEGKYNSFADFLASKKAFRSSTNTDILVALDDGTVMYDSGKTNTFANYVAKTINTDNHNTRPEILNAVLSSSGTGYSRRYSSSSKAVRQYYAVRLGLSAQANVATLRVAIKE